MEEKACKSSALSPQNPIWFFPKTGIYTSKHPPILLPQNPLLDLVTFLFSKPHKGEKALIDSLSGLFFSYPDLRSKVESLASCLHQIGILKGQVVLLLLPNSIFFPIILLSILSLGAIITTMNPLSTLQEIKKQTVGLNVSLVFAPPEKVGILDSLGVHVVSVPSDLKYDFSSFALFDKMISCKQRVSLRPVIQQSDTAAILFTSGTSGSSKGVVLTHGNFIAMVELFVLLEASQYEKESWKDVYLATILMFHAYGISVFVLGLISLGSTIVVMRRFDIQEAIRAIDKYEITHLPLVPPIMAALMKAKDATGCGLKSLKVVLCGGAPLSPKLIQEFLCRFEHVDLIQAYGMTESAIAVTRGLNTKDCKKYTSSGPLTPNMEARVVDQEARKFLPPGKVGELWLRGPTIMKGYLNDEKETRSKFDGDGWFKTGDIAYFDQDGYIFIVDRLKDVIKYKGFQIAPADLEAVLTSNAEIIDAAVTSDLDEEAGEIPVAFVVRRHDSNISAAEIIKFVAEKVAPYKKVRRVVFVQSIPRSPTGKILRRELRSCHGASKM